MKQAKLVGRKLIAKIYNKPKCKNKQHIESIMFFGECPACNKFKKGIYEHTKRK